MTDISQLNSDPSSANAPDPAPQAENVRHLRVIRWFLGAILTVLLLAAAFFAKDVILPIVLGLLLALTLSPLVRGMRRIGVPPPLAAALLVFTFGLAMVTAMYFLASNVSYWIDEAPRLTNELRGKLSGVADSVDAVQNASKEVEEMAGGDEQVQEVVIERRGLLSMAVTNVASFATTLGVGLLVALFLLASGDLFHVKLVEAFDRFAEKRRALSIVYDIERRISRYLLAITLINAALGACVASAMYVIGLPSYLLWGVAAFALNYLPFLGGMIGVVLIGCFSIITFDSFGYAFVPPLVYLALTSLEANIVTPYLLGRQLELNAFSVLITVIFWAWLWGVPGALMAVPFLVFLKVICDHVDRLRVFGSFISARRLQIPVEEANTDTGEQTS